MPKNIFAKPMEKLDTWYHDGKSKEERTKEKSREWQRQIRGECRRLDRDINRIRQEEAKLKREIEMLAKKGNYSSVRTLAGQVVRSRNAVRRLERVKCSLSAVNLHLTTATATMATGSSVKMSAKVMKEMNGLMDVPEMHETIQKMRREMAKAEIMDEMIEEGFADSDVEEEADAEVARVLDELHLDTARLLAGAARVNVASGVAAPAPMPARNGPLLDQVQAR